MPKKLDLTGQRFSRLVAIKVYEAPIPEKARKWLCICDCGNNKAITTSALRAGSTKKLWMLS